MSSGQENSTREAGPGIHAKIPFIDRVVGRINLRVQPLDVETETKTEDNLFLRMVVAVQYYVLPEKVYDAFYKLDNARDGNQRRARRGTPAAPMPLVQREKRMMIEERNGLEPPHSSAAADRPPGQGFRLNSKLITRGDKP